MNWLSGDDNLINVQPRANPDSSLTLSRGMLTAIVLLFLVTLPLALLGAGGAIWWRRRKA